MNVKLLGVKVRAKGFRLAKAYCSEMYKIGLCFEFNVMENFSKEKNKDKYNDWISPTKYTHPGGYNFCIGINANGCDESRRKAITVELWSKPGDFDNVLVWSAKFVFTIELLNCKGGYNRRVKSFCKWAKRDITMVVGRFSRNATNKHCFIQHTELDDYLLNDCLFFKVTWEYFC